MGQGSLDVDAPSTLTFGPQNVLWAIKGDRERCLAAGMDEYITKPVQMSQIADVLRQLQCQKDARSEETIESAVMQNCDEAEESSGLSAIDVESLLARCLGNVEFAASLLDELESTAQERVDSIQQHSEQQDAAGLAEAAHALKGAAGILCAGTVETLAGEIEQAGRAAHLDGVESMIRDLRGEMQRCLDALPVLREEMVLENTESLS